MNDILKAIVGAVLEEGKTTDEIRNDRIAICNNCDFRKGEKCGVCGCFYELKAEMDFNKNPKKMFRVEKTHCPEGFWPYLTSEGVRMESDIEIAQYYSIN